MSEFEFNCGSILEIQYYFSSLKKKFEDYAAALRNIARESDDMSITVDSEDAGLKEFVYIINAIIRISKVVFDLSAAMQSFEIASDEISDIYYTAESLVKENFMSVNLFDFDLHDITANSGSAIHTNEKPDDYEDNRINETANSGSAIHTNEKPDDYEDNRINETANSGLSADERNAGIHDDNSILMPIITPNIPGVENYDPLEKLWEWLKNIFDKPDFQPGMLPNLNGGNYNRENFLEWIKVVFPDGIPWEIYAPLVLSQLNYGYIYLPFKDLVFDWWQKFVSDKTEDKNIIDKNEKGNGIFNNSGNGKSDNESEQISHSPVNGEDNQYSVFGVDAGEKQSDENEKGNGIFNNSGNGKSDNESEQISHSPVNGEDNQYSVFGVDAGEKQSDENEKGNGIFNNSGNGKSDNESEQISHSPVNGGNNPYPVFGVDAGKTQNNEVFNKNNDINSKFSSSFESEKNDDVLKNLSHITAVGAGIASIGSTISTGSLSSFVGNGASDKDLSKDKSKGISDEASKGISDEVSKGISDEVSKGISDEVSENVGNLGEYTPILTSNDMLSLNMPAIMGTGISGIISGPFPLDEYNREFIKTQKESGFGGGMSASAGIMKDSFAASDISDIITNGDNIVNQGFINENAMEVEALNGEKAHIHSEQIKYVDDLHEIENVKDKIEQTSMNISDSISDNTNDITMMPENIIKEQVSKGINPLLFGSSIAGAVAVTAAEGGILAGTVAGSADANRKNKDDGEYDPENNFNINAVSKPSVFAGVLDGEYYILGTAISLLFCGTTFAAGIMRKEKIKKPGFRTGDGVSVIISGGVIQDKY